MPEPKPIPYIHGSLLRNDRAPELGSPEWFRMWFGERSTVVDIYEARSTMALHGITLSPTYATS